MNRIKTKKGFNLTETILVMLIIGVIVAGIFITYTQLNSNNNINQDFQTFSILKNDINHLTSNNKNYEGITSSTLLKLETIGNFAKQGNDLVNSKNSPINIKVRDGDWTHGSKDLITMKAQGYNRKHCAKLVSRLSSEFFVTVVNGQLVKLDETGNVNVTSINCKEDNNTIAFNMAKPINISRYKDAIDKESLDDASTTTGKGTVYVMCRAGFNACVTSYCSNKAKSVFDLKQDFSCKNASYNHPNAFDRKGSGDVFLKFEDTTPEDMAKSMCGTPSKIDATIYGQHYLYSCGKIDAWMKGSNLKVTSKHYISDIINEDNDEQGTGQGSGPTEEQVENLNKLKEELRSMLNTYQACSVENGNSTTNCTVANFN